MKICCTCKENKEIDDFHNRKDTKDGKSYRCKKCASEITKQQKKI